MILDAPKESPLASEGVSRPPRARPTASSSLPPSRLPRRTAAVQDAPAQPSSTSLRAPHTLESTRNLILTGQTEQALLAQTEILFSILNLLTAQNQRSDELETESVQSTLPPYSRPSTPPLAHAMPSQVQAPAWSPPYQPTPSTQSPSTPRAGPSSPSPCPSPTNSVSSSLPSPPTTPIPPSCGRTTPTPRRPFSPDPDSLSNKSSPVTLEAAPINQALRNHLASLGVRVLSRVQAQMVDALKTPSPGQSLIVQGGACEGKTTGLIMSLLNHVRHPSPNPTSPQILLLTPGADSAATLRELLPSHSRAIKSLTIHSADPREDARNLTYVQPNVVIGTVQRCVELAGGGVKGKGRAGSLDLSGVRWVGVEAGVWADEAARKAWHQLVACGMGGIRSTVRYCVIEGQRPTPNLELYLNPLMNPRREILTITGQSDLDFVRSPAVKHFHIASSSSFDSLLSIYKSTLLRCPTLIFCETPASVRDLSRRLEEHRAEWHSLHPDDDPSGKHVIIPSSSTNSSGTKTTVPFLTTPFTAHTMDRVAIVVNFDGTLTADEYLKRAVKLDAHGSGRRLILTFTETSEQEAAFLDLDIELSDPQEMIQTSCLRTSFAS